MVTTRGSNGPRFFVIIPKTKLDNPPANGLFMKLAPVLVFLALGLVLPPSAQAIEPVEPQMVLIPAGSFTAGSSAAEREAYLPALREMPARKVDLPAYWIGKHEVTNAQYQQFMEDGGYHDASYWSEAGWRFRQERGWEQPRRWNDPGFAGWRREQHAVAAVSLYEAEAFCRWLASKTEKAYRLPTELEWEKAARGPDGRIFPWGDDWRPSACNWLGAEEGLRLPTMKTDGYHWTAPVGSYPQGASPYGCLDMAGNVMEWCDSRMETPALSIERPVYVLKGGCFFSGHRRLLRCAWRGGAWPEIGHVYWGEFGFRVALDGDEREAPHASMQ